MKKLSYEEPKIEIRNYSFPLSDGIMTTSKDPDLGEVGDNWDILG